MSDPVMAPNLDARWSYVPAGAVIDGWSLPFGVLRCHGRDAKACLDAQRGTHPGAILIGSRDSLVRLLQQVSAAEPPAEILAEAATLRAAELHEARLYHLVNAPAEDDDAALPSLDEAEAMLGTLVETLNLGDSLRTPDAAEADAAALLTQIEEREATAAPGPIDPVAAFAKDEGTEAWFDAVYVALLPVEGPAHAPAHLPMAAGGGRPSAAEQVAYLSHWAARYGAVLVGYGAEMATFAVARPPTTAEAALQLAEEHYSFCPGGLADGDGSLDGWADALMAAESWQFWWV